MTVASSPPAPQSLQPLMGGEPGRFSWQWQGTAVQVAYEALGDGPPVLLLPAFSTVSSRSEMADMARQLAPRFRVTALDWPGFGDSDRQPLNYGPDLYQACLQDFVAHRFPAGTAVVAAGHAAGYVLRAGQQQPGLWSRQVLVAPTWRGPLAIMGVPAPLRNGIKRTVWSPGLGQGLYYLNTRPGFLRFMYRRHVYTDPNRLTPAYIQQRYDNTQRPNARFAPAAFVTGGLDPATSAEQVQGWLTASPSPTLVITADQCPPTSRREMAAMAAIDGVQSLALAGSLGLAEEYAPAVAAAAAAFLAG